MTAEPSATGEKQLASTPSVSEEKKSFRVLMRRADESCGRTVASTTCFACTLPVSALTVCGEDSDATSVTRVCSNTLQPGNLAK